MRSAGVWFAVSRLVVTRSVRLSCRLGCGGLRAGQLWYGWPGLARLGWVKFGSAQKKECRRNKYG